MRKLTHIISETIFTTLYMCVLCSLKMGTFTSISGCFIALLGAYFINLAAGQDTCTKTTSCICTFLDGTTVDLNPIANSGGTPRFAYKKDPNADFEYAYNPCNPFTDGTSCTNVAACQRSTGATPLYYSTGTQDTAVFSSDGSEISYSTTEGRKTDVKLICDQGANSPKYEVLGETSPDSGEYELQITSCAACRGGCTGGGGSGNLSFGSILCILFVVLVFVYLVGGILFNRYARGASGKEVIPNVSLWEEFPMLVKDGFVFVASCCKSDSQSYESI